MIYFRKQQKLCALLNKGNNLKSLNMGIQLLVIAFMYALGSNEIIVYFWSGCIRGVVGEGMPGYRRPYDKGNLYIKFEIEFPPNNFIPCDKISVSICGLQIITCSN